MAFKMNGNPIKMGKMATKATLYQKKEVQGPVPEKNPGVMKGEYEGTYVYEGKGTKGFKGTERINDLEDRIGFLVNNDIPDAKAAGDTKKVEKLQKTVKKLRTELAILKREVKADKKQPPMNYHVKGGEADPNHPTTPKRK